MATTDLVAAPPIGCYTTARFEGGSVRHAIRHARRLIRDARAIGLEPPGEDDLVGMLAARGHEAFGAGAGVIRMALRHDEGRMQLFVETRSLGEERRAWRAIVARTRHPGPTPGAPGAKLEPSAALDRARAEAARAGVDEVLLLDGDGRVVEGARSSIFVARADGSLTTPPIACGGVAGIAREIVLDLAPDAREAAIDSAALADAVEIVCTNAVRGARRIETLDGRRLEDRSGSRWSECLDALLRSDRGSC